MCGIAGILKFGGGLVESDEIGCLMASIKHRGPDAQGHWISNKKDAALIHTRLSILDLSSHSAQPMVTSDSRYVIVFNGEVYNFMELNEDLKKLGYESQHRSDTEVILTAYKEWGLDAFDRFNGMWALAIYDTLEYKLVLSRDRYGVKPLYYYIDRDLFVFASEIQAIHKLIPQRISPNWSFLGQMFQYDMSPFGGEQTYLCGVKAVLPGFFAQVVDGSLKCLQWYWLNRIDVPTKYDQQVLRMRELLESSCKLRLRSDVPVATCLSGGIDSGSIVSILGEFSKPESSRFCHLQHTAFTAGFPAMQNDETIGARSVASKCNMVLDVKDMESPSVQEFERALFATDGPMPTLAFFPIWKLYEYVKSKGISVTLDGQGADEMLGGYYLGYPAMRGSMQLVNIPMLFDLYKTYGNLNMAAGEWIKNDFKTALDDTRYALDQQLKNPLKVALARLGMHRIKPSMLRQSLKKPVYIRESLFGPDNWLESALFTQFFTTPLPFLLHQYDRCSMASGVECRMPFMDYRLVEYAFSLPLRSRIGKGFTKRILRDSVRGTLQESIRVNKIKTGFNAPFKEWMQGTMKQWLLDITDTQQFRDLPQTDACAIRKRIENATPESASLERNDWARIHTAFWLRQTEAYAFQGMVN